MQQQCIQQNYQHELATLKQQNWGTQAFRTNQTQNQTQKYTNFQSTNQYQQPQPIPVQITSPIAVQTTTLASPTHGSGCKSLPNTPRGRNYSPIKPPIFNDTPTRNAQPPVQQAQFITNVAPLNPSLQQSTHSHQQQQQNFSESLFTTNQSRQ